MKRKAQPTRRMPMLAAQLPAYGPEVRNLYPRVMSSPNCSWCGTELLERASARVCPECDLAPSKTNT